MLCKHFFLSACGSVRFALFPNIGNRVFFVGDCWKKAQIRFKAAVRRFKPPYSSEGDSSLVELKPQIRKIK
jgi:hypothetical protein